MKRLFTIALAASFALPVAASAAPEKARVRGTVSAISATTLTVHTATGDVPVTLGGSTKYLKVVKSSLSNIDKDSYIGTATKTVGSMMIALEVVVFPPAMKGAGEGHYGWDKIPDTTLSGGGSTSSSMTNGSVAAVAASTQGAAVNSSMTNGSVASATSQDGAKTLTVTYKGGQQTILVPPTAPIVTFKPGALSDVTAGAHVFINAMKDGDKVTANSVAVGTDGVVPPM